jgi:hypothetical protein
VTEFARLSAGPARQIARGIFCSGDAEASRMMDRKRCIVADEASMEAFDCDERPNPALARKCRAGEVNGSHRFMRAGRSICRLPHGRSGDELVRTVIERNAATETTR